MAWNTNLEMDCSNLYGGAAYCVNGKAASGGNAKRSWVYARATDESGPVQTAAPELNPDIVDGGVPLHWPEIDAPRYRQMKGAAIEPAPEDLKEASIDS